MRAETVGIFGENAARVLHDLVARMLGIRRNHADVGGHDVRFHFERDFHNALGFGNQFGIQARVAEAHAQIAAQRGEYHAVVLHQMKEIAALRSVHLRAAHFVMARVDLKTLRAELRRRGHRLLNRQTEGFKNNTDREPIHREKHLRIEHSDTIIRVSKPRVKRKYGGNALKLCRFGLDLRTATAKPSSPPCRRCSRRRS